MFRVLLGEVSCFAPGDLHAAVGYLRGLVTGITAFTDQKAVPTDSRFAVAENTIMLRAELGGETTPRRVTLPGLV
jgi:hypothetical protein